MAYSKAPMMDTYSSARVSVFREIFLRDGGLASKDEEYINCFIESPESKKSGDGRRFLLKRAGVDLAKTIDISSSIRGSFYWANENKVVIAVEDKLIVWNITTDSLTTINAFFTTFIGTVGICEFLYEDDTNKLCISDGTTLYTLDNTNTKVVNSDTDLPPHNPNIVFLDGYLFAVASNSSKILNSVNNNPLSWEPDTFIMSEMEGDKLLQIVKTSNYIVAIGKTTIEFFWDAGNAAPDSPLQRNDTPIKNIMVLGGISQYENSIYFIGIAAGGKPELMTLKDFKVESVSSATLNRIFTESLPSLPYIDAKILSVQGHTFYIFTYNGNSWVIDLDGTYIYKWKYQNTNTFPLNQFIVTPSGNYFSFVGNATLYKFNINKFQDISTNFTVGITTGPLDFGTINRKSMSRLSLLCDETVETSNVVINYTDNNYKTWSTNFNLDIGTSFPVCYQLGNFRQRAFKLSYTDNYPLRIWDIEIDINKGNS